ncbi:hypothetical protein VFPBJ_11205 [Purpureocillium lilacinum]|uniref:Uncharacterized protein n=1 Tax=Purpureocillium lilacinum TaxID=33203 RepID=A0A179FIV6_PURLI|nr:hypothetical protein VFPBJ_11205 [Purpureocillium lilacinum]
MARNSPTSGQMAAKSLVQSIALEHGYIREAVYARMDSDMRREVRAAMGAKDKLIGSSAMLLARELYSRDVRFIFELLQNADDNVYSNATSAPYAAFYLFHKKVIVECNEDGFTEAHLRAICSIGNSSKVGNHGYTGEKGIGFKSVFKFLIQTDFVTMANREDIVSSSSRNLALLDNIADAFIKAIHQMYNHETLRYQWMRYLRNMKTYPWETFWKRLVEKIENRLGTAEILEPRRRGSPRIVSDLNPLVPIHCDLDGHPLFEDLPGRAEKYISTEYRDDDLHILRDYGIAYMAQDAFLERVKHDLSRTNSRMKNPATSQAWHTRAAKSFDLSFRNQWTARIQETKALAILPLTDGRWASSSGCEVFFPVIGDGIHIPVDLELNILALSACGNAERAKLFKNLGAVQANVPDVRQRILLKYGVQKPLPYRPGSVSLEMSYSHLAFLYHTHEEKDVSQLRYLVLFDTEGRARRPSVADCYFANDDPYSLWQLSQEGQDEWFKSNISFVHGKGACESEALIFVQESHGDYLWVKPSECLWSTATDIRNRITLNNYYDDVLEDFFVTALGVSRVTIDMIYDELYTADRANVTLEHVKSSLGILCTLLETEKLKPTQTPAKLLERPILPVRIATHLRSPRARSSDQVQTFYALLLKAETWETNGISATLILPQDGLHTTVELEQGEVYIDDKGDILNIYVPRDEESQDVCFGSALPEKLVEWMATDPSTLQIEGSMAESMVKVVTGVLGTRSPSAMQRILDMQGIVDIDVAIETPDVALEQTDQSRTGTAVDEPNRPQHQEESITFSIRSRSNSTSSSTLANEFAMSTPAPSSRTGSRAPHDTGVPNGHEGGFSHDTYIEIQSHHHRHRQIPYRPISTITTASNDCYRALL